MIFLFSLKTKEVHGGGGYNLGSEKMFSGTKVISSRFGGFQGLNIELRRLVPFRRVVAL